MNRILLLAVSLFTIVLSGQAQRYAIVDTKYILEKIPDYKQAQQKLDQFSEQWQKEIDSKQKEIIEVKKQPNETVYSDQIEIPPKKY